MDSYLISLLIGAIGLTAMGLMGLGSRGHHRGGGRGSISHGRAARSHGPGHARGGHTRAGGRGSGHQGNRSQESANPHVVHAASLLWQLMSPRVVFSIALGLGATGLALKPVIGGPILLAAAIAGGIALERFIVLPLWNVFMRFGSNPAMTLESAIMSEAIAVSSFDRKGHGLVSVEVDGHVIQLLATLDRAEVAAGERVRAGDTVRIEAVDAAHNRCTVTRL